MPTRTSPHIAKEDHHVRSGRLNLGDAKAAEPAKSANPKRFTLSHQIRPRSARQARLVKSRQASARAAADLEREQGRKVFMLSWAGLMAPARR